MKLLFFFSMIKFNKCTTKLFGESEGRTLILSSDTENFDLLKKMYTFG